MVMSARLFPGHLRLAFGLQGQESLSPEDL